MSEDETIHTGPVVAASLSLLAFMLAIVFGAVDSRVSELKHVVLDEANAIGTALLRTDLMPQAHRTAIRQLLQDYVTLRIEAVGSGTPQQIEQAIKRSEQMQSDLWARAVSIAEQKPTPIAVLFVQSLNELIDLHEKRITLSVHYRLPGWVWLMLFGLAILAMAMAGYDIGLTGNRRSFGIAVSAALAFSVVLLMVVVLDRPRQYLSTVTGTAMTDLLEDIRR